MQSLNKLVYIGFIASLIALFFSIKECSNHSGEYNQAKEYLASLNDTVMHLKNGIAQAKAVEVSKDLFAAIVGENEALKKMLKDAQIKASNVRQSTRIVTVTKIDTLKIPLHDTIPCPAFNPIAFSVDSVHYSIGGYVSKDFISIDKIKFPDSIYVVTAEKKHFLRKDEYVVAVKHSNPYINTIGVTNLTITDKKKWWHSGWIKAGAGFAAGCYLTYKLRR